MKIDKLNIENITVFDKLELNPSQGINVIIGENGTGKTQILKLIYAICASTNYRGREIFDVSHPYFRTNTINLVRDKNDINKKSFTKVSYTDESYLTYELIRDIESKWAGEGRELYNISNKTKSLFIPAKEMLSHSQGFLALNNKYDLPFDKTYVDIITNAELPETREVSPINQKILDIISKVIEGTVVYENDTFYIVKENGNKVEFSLEAEGLRKFGLLWKLIRNGLIEKDTILLWDEPEANINPELMPIIVDILLELQREGVQIFIATHSYNLAKYFEIKRKDDDNVLFHSLYKTENGVKVQSDKYFGELDNNSIIEADSKLLDEVIEESFED